MGYSKGKIYRLVCNTTGQQYIGSTIQPLSYRLSMHKANYKMFLKGTRRNNTTSFSILSENNFEMILIEDYPCENKNQLERRERHFIETMKCLNMIKPAQTREERLEYQKIRSALTNCDCGGHYQHKHKSEHFKTIMHTSFFE
jgi:hypothetical protein